MNTTSTFTKRIVFDCETRDYIAEIDGDIIGFYHNYHDAEIALDQLVYELLSSGLTRSASELDAGSDVDEIAAAISAPSRCVRCDAPVATDTKFCHDCLAKEAQLREEDDDTAPSEEDTNWGHWRCAACDGPHHVQRCPKLMVGLFAPDEPWGTNEVGPPVELVA